MDSRAKIITIFLGALTLIALGAIVAIFVGGFKFQLVAPAFAIAVAVSVSVFAYRFNAALKNQSLSATTDMSSSLSSPERTPGIKFLRVVTTATLCVGAVMIVSFLVEARMGVLDPDDVRRFAPKIAFGVALAGYILHKTSNKPQS
jgi:hypothetical protein